MQDFVFEIKNMLKKVTDEPEAEAWILITEVENKTKTEIFTQNKIEKQKEIMELVKKRVETRMPVQYLVGFAYFMGEKFKVTPDVLIPRDETSILVLETLKKIKNNDKILEIGAGSGIISVMLSKKFKGDIEILSVDVSTSALKIAINNALSLTEPKRIVFRKSDVFSNIKEKFNIIVSNPPYVPFNFKIQPELTYEPKIALFSEDDGLFFYKKIIKESREHLFDNGFLFFENGINQSYEIKKIFEENGFSDIKVVKDLNNIERVIYAHI